MQSLRKTREMGILGKKTQTVTYTAFKNNRSSPVENLSFILKNYCLNIMLIASYRKKNPFLVSFPENVYVIICSTGPRRSDYTNISGNGPKIFQIFIAKLSCNHTGSNPLGETSSWQKQAGVGSEGDDAMEDVLWS